MNNEVDQILQTWDTWAKDNGRPDMRKPIWRIFDLFSGVRYPGQMEAIETFLCARVASPDLEKLRDAVNKAARQ